MTEAAAHSLSLRYMGKKFSDLDRYGQTAYATLPRRTSPRTGRDRSPPWSSRGAAQGALHRRQFQLHGVGFD